MRRSGSVLFFAAISLALHLAWVVLMPEGQVAVQPATHWVEVSFEAEPAPSLEGAVAASPAEEPSPPEQPSAPQPKAEPRNKERLAKPARPQARPMELAAAQPSAPPNREPAQLAAAEPSSTESSQLPAAAPSASEASQLAAAEPAPVKPKPLAILPRSAALSLDALGGASSLRCGGNRATQGQTDCAPSEAEIGQAAQAALTRDLDAAAHSVAHLKAREHPKLKRRSDGSYAYEGGVFQATIRPDGNVEFRDTAIGGELKISPVPFVYTADLNDLVEKHVLGREMYSAEKQWLIEETRTLRDQLASEFRRREQQGANRELERVLRGVLDDSALTVAKKHEAIFLLWQDCGEDSQAHREAVVRFVRRYMPKGSTLGFLADELEHFNADRGRLQRFEPYGT
ncbi:MAG TPA: hypothetical protein VMF89_11770 [Polyangiales bacterium]|nr:hypothetical protein [Polyangiales bacterium]